MVATQVAGLRGSTNVFSAADKKFRAATADDQVTSLKQVNPSSGTEVYPHMPILRPHAALFHERRISSVAFTSAHLYDNVYMRVSSDFRLLGSKVYKHESFPALDADEPPCKI